MPIERVKRDDDIALLMTKYTSIDNVELITVPSGSLPLCAFPYNWFGMFQSVIIHSVT